MKKVLFLSIVLVLLAVIGYSSYQLLDINRSTAQEAELHNQLMQYRPAPQFLISVSPLDEFSDESYTEADLVLRVNQSIVDLQASHPDAVGWLTIPNTRVDYPFVQGVDNKQYLHLDLNQNQSAAGTIFMDFRNNSDFSDFNTIIYGHHMRSGSMFAALQEFDKQAFFEANRTGTIFLANATYEIEFFAFAVIQPNDAMIYNPAITTDTDRIAFLDYINTTARHWRDIGATENDRIVTLSTCNYEFNNARMVLVGRLIEN